jgi:NAD(P)-dependent dehydrogenase (short-subunit alcohol dehydrogenase family)
MTGVPAPPAQSLPAPSPWAAAPPAQSRVALVTGASRGLGRALTTRLVAAGWRVVGDGRDAAVLAAAVRDLDRPELVAPVAGDVADPRHRTDLVAAVERLGRLDLLVANASALGPTPLPPLAELDPADLERVLAVNVVAPLALVRALLPVLRRCRGRIVTVSSDAAVEAYPGWGAYGASKAALDHLSAVLAVEEADLRVYAVDPGDMATAMHVAAVPDADPAGLAAPDDVVPALLRLAEGGLPSGRYRAADLRPAGTGS